MTLSMRKFSITTLSTRKFTIRKFSTTTLSMRKFSIKTHNITIRESGTQHNDT